MNTWIEITNDAGEVEAVCTLAEFRTANEYMSNREIVVLDALRPLPDGDGCAMGGGATPLVYVYRCSENRAAALDEIVRGAGPIEIRGADPNEDPEESGALPWSIWADGSIIGADTTLARTIDDALRTVHGWARVDENPRTGAVS